ncbi:putative secreted RxLR effector protein [Phytophthora cinnamomi]|uniref:putative secreted RxLR effector protein n=1 Tax=Phytophthora cinnamomi TaxID=4785 RepID=UPI002B2B6513|nr:putative secreted RxLR effector protein [Phytophthora cinnamomi]QVE55525.1 RxLR effector protein 12a [Phytophthora cinnamomi]
MRSGCFLLVAVCALFVSCECDAASPATSVLKIETQDLVDDLANGDVSKSRFLRSDDTTGVDDVGTNDAKNEERVSLKGLLGVIKQKMTSATMPLDLNTAIIPEKVKADFSNLYIKNMKENDTFKMVFDKWDVYTVEEIMSKMKSIPKRDRALVLEYLNRRSEAIRGGNIVTGKANINPKPDSV